MIMSLLDVGYLDPWGSLSFGLGFLLAEVIVLRLSSIEKKPMKREASRGLF